MLQGWNRLALGIMAAGVAALIASGVLLTLTLMGKFDGVSGPGTSTAIGKSISDYLTPEATPTAPLPPPSEAPIARLAIPKFDIDAPVVVRGLDGNGVMEVPDGPTDVAWYEFTKKPGFGGNAVFSGHVDYINYGPAVFWHLKDLNQGDIIEVRLDDGTVYQYAMASRQNVSAEPTQQEIDGIVGQTPNDVITLITCGGTFSYETHQYDQRVIIRAERVVNPAPQASSGG